MNMFYGVEMNRRDVQGSRTIPEIYGEPSERC